MNKNHVLRSIGASALVLSASASAAVPAYITSALTSAQTTFVEYVEAAAPMVFALVTIIAAVFLVVRLVKRAAS